MSRPPKPHVNCICKMCKINFSIYPSAFYKGEGIYCSSECFHKSRIGKLGPNAGRKFSKIWIQRIKERAMGRFTGSKNSQWKGGKIIDGKGYIRIKSLGHPFRQQSGYVMEHRIIMEKHLSRYLKPTEVVHHINRIVNDNRIENLKLFNNDFEHRQYHRNNPITIP